MIANRDSYRPFWKAPLFFFSRVATKLNTIWLRATYPFAAFGRRVSVHYSCDISRSISGFVSLGDDVYMAPDVWLNTAPGSGSSASKIVLGRGCKIGRRTTISSRNQIILEADVLLAPSVLLMDHNHEFNDTELPIHAQGVTEGGKIVIERNCWLGHGAVIVCNYGELTLGRNSVVGANAVVTKSFPPFSVIAGNPAKLLKTYDERTRKWIKPHE
ncbi:MAG: acyltransferase [Acidobacteriia bacterium]|nr:acyltransferase [Terriglobia bacterium]